VLAAGVALFHFANAPMLPLLTQKLALAHAGAETVLVAACVVTAQLVSIPTALLVGARADTWGRKPLLLAGFAALPLRGVLYTLSDDPVFLIAGQALDGISLGILDALIALVLADIMRGTGRYNAARGLLGTVQGIGGSLSNVVAGLIVVTAGYGVAFLTLAAVALTAFMVMLATMPETGEKSP
jgi:MFS family permease